MKIKAAGFAGFAILFALFAASNAFADGIHGHDSSDSNVTVEGSGPAIHDASMVTNQLKDNDQDSDRLPQPDHVLAWPSGRWWLADCHKDPDPSVPEPPAILLLAAGLTPFLWVRRKGGGS
jgi:hypothetical protein